MNPRIFADLSLRLKRELNFNLDTFNEIEAGWSNKLFCLTSKERNKLLLKVYFSVERQPLKKEYTALEFLNARHIDNVPNVYFNNADLNYAVYSYEEGFTKEPNKLTKDDIGKMVKFVVSIHNILPEKVTSDFPIATMACFSFQDYINNINHRLELFEKYVKTENLHPKVANFLREIDIIKIVKNLTSQEISKYTSEELSKPISHKRLSPVDFGPHNIIFKDSGELVFIDFEHFGWDDPLRIIAEFPSHDQTYDVSKENKELFLDQYRNLVNLPELMMHRLDTLTKLVAIEWLTIFLKSITAEDVKQTEFADKNFDPDSFLDEQISKLRKHLIDIEN